MRPEDLVEFSRQTYAKQNNVKSWGRHDLVDSGLNSDETTLLEMVPLKHGKLLLLGVGGGREAIPLARIGFNVTGVDFVPEAVQKARENARKRGIEISGLVQEISMIDVPAGSYDIAWLSADMYSCVPTRKRRIKMLKRINKSLRHKGYFVCQFHWDTRLGFSRKAELARKAFAFLTLGNLWYEKGDMLWSNVEFIHAFSSTDELRSEFEAGGFELIHIHTPAESTSGGAVLKKA
ncbi:class I SAM-dependent methyltransferase [Thermodesulfobacteriota bacterium]